MVFDYVDIKNFGINLFSKSILISRYIQKFVKTLVLAVYITEEILYSIGDGVYN